MYPDSPGSPDSRNCRRLLHGTTAEDPFLTASSRLDSTRLASCSSPPVRKNNHPAPAVQIGHHDPHGVLFDLSTCRPLYSSIICLRSWYSSSFSLFLALAEWETPSCNNNCESYRNIQWLFLKPSTGHLKWPHVCSNRTRIGGMVLVLKFQNIHFHRLIECRTDLTTSRCGHGLKALTVAFPTISTALSQTHGNIDRSTIRNLRTAAATRCRHCHSSDWIEGPHPVYVRRYATIYVSLY